MRGTCGICCAANIHNLLLQDEKSLTENDVVGVAIDENLCEVSSNPLMSGGTSTLDVLELIDKVGGPNHKLIPEVFCNDNVMTVEQLANRLDRGEAAVVGVDSASLWDQRGDVTGSDVFQEEAPSDHWITVRSAERDEKGNLVGFNIIDSGGGCSYVDKDKFEQIYLGDEKHRVTDPTIIMVSRNDTGKPIKGSPYNFAEETLENIKGASKEVRETREEELKEKQGEILEAFFDSPSSNDKLKYDELWEPILSLSFVSAKKLSEMLQDLNKKCTAWRTWKLQSSTT